MLQNILFYIFIITGSINLVHFALYIIGANIYDAKKTRKRILNSKKVYRKKKLPLVSVIIPAYNESKVVRRCLQSVWDSSYEKIEVIIVNDGSSDNTSNVVRKYFNSRAVLKTLAACWHTKNSLRRGWNKGEKYIERRLYLLEQSNAGKAEALNFGIKTKASGSLIMTLDADSVLHKSAVACAVKYFDDPQVVGVAANVRIIEESTILGLLQRFEHMVAYRSKKLFTVLNCEFLVGGVASTYRLNILKKVGYYSKDSITEDIGLSMKIAALGNKKYKLVYASDVAAMTEGVQNLRMLLKQRYRWKLGTLQNIFKFNYLLLTSSNKYTKSLTWYRFPMAFLGELLLLLEPITLAYTIYIAIHFKGFQLIIGAYLTITVYLLMVIWPDEHMSWKSKIKASILTPYLYFIFYIMNFVQLSSIIKCLFNLENIFDVSKRNNNWISPSRRGKAASFN